MRFENHDYAEFYDRQQTEAGYPGMLLSPVIETLEGFNSVIDIGAGTGFFTIPLLEAGHRVTAIEPSSEMSSIILKKCRSELKDRLLIVNEQWENWHGENHDASICIHSLYPIEERRKAIELMYRYSRKRIIIVREPSEMITLSSLTRNRLGIELSRDFNDEIKNVLRSIGAHYDIIKITEERPHRIWSIEHEAESVTYQLRLDESFRDKVQIIIQELCASDSSGLFF